jgi:outer membrane protein assembly factor BamB
MDGLKKRRTSKRFALVALVLAACLTGCTTDWDTWGDGVQRLSANPSETTIGTGNVASLTQAWSRPLLGNVNAAPVVAAGVNVNGQSIDLAYLGDEHGGFYAVNVATGSVVWAHALGFQKVNNCTDAPDQIFGTSSTAVIDRPNNLVYVAAADGKVHAFDLATGTEAPNWPVTVTTIPNVEFMQSALTLFQGRLYAETSSHCDFGAYMGRIVAIDTAVHAITHTFNLEPPGVLGGSVWGWGGVSIDPANGDVYAATGNALGADENAGYANSVLRLDRDLDIEAANQPALLGGDDDFGSTPVLYQRSGCPAQLIALRKDGRLFVYNRDSIAPGPTQTIRLQGFTFIGSVAYVASTNMVYVATTKDLPGGPYIAGMHAFQVQADCTLALKWQTNVPPSGSETTTTPVVANGVVYYGDGVGSTLYAFNATTGQQLWTSGNTITGGVFAAPIVINGTVLVGAWDAKLHAYRTP